MTNHIKKNLILLLTLAGLSAYAQIPVNPPGGGGTGVTSINSTTGAFTFTGSGVDCTGTACDFSGTGSGIGSIAWTVPSWLTASPSTISASGPQAFTATTGQTSHQVIGTCGTATSFTPCALVAGDIPILNQSTTGSAATLTTSRTIAGTSFNGSANIALANKFIVQGTTDSGLSAAQFLGALGTGSLCNTTTTGVLSICGATNLAGTGAGGVTGLLPHANIASTAVTPGSYTNANITVAADGSVTAAANGSGSGLADCTDTTGVSFICTVPITAPSYSTSGSTQGFDAYGVGTGTISTTLPTNYVGIIGPPSGTPTYFLQLPSANPTAGQTMVFAAPTSVNGVSQAVGTWATPGTGTTVTVASGTATLGTTAIASGACATVVTVTATGAASTDSIIWNPNASIKAVTGYAPSTSGGLNVAPYPTSGNVNFDVCNSSASSITPGAVTLNWRIVR